MKRIFESLFASRRYDEFAHCLNEKATVAPDALRWLNGEHDLDTRVVCQLV